MADKCPCGVLYPSTGFAIDTLFCCCSDGGSDEGIVIAADADINDTPVVGAIAIPITTAATKTGITIVEFTSLVLLWFLLEEGIFSLLEII
jgi:hypothetical protein